MNRTLVGILITVVVSLLISAPGTSAQSIARAAVPFAFTVGQTSMPAGTYIISPVSPSVIEIRDSNTGKGVLSFVRSEQAGSSDGAPKLVFRKYGNSYFLSQVWRGFGSDVMQLPTSKLEKELQIANTGSFAQKTVVATK